MADDTYQEIEVKLLVPDLATVEATLTAAGATLEAPRVYERNVRYEDTHNSLTRRGIVVRLRKDHKIRLTYKGPKGHKAVDNGVHKRLEVEVAVDNFEAAEAILGHLGYHPYMVYEKYRTTYSLMGTEVVLDEMPFGSFVEVEGPDEPTILAVLEALGLEDAPRLPRSYATLFTLLQKRLDLDFHDLTFDNFAGVEVPLHALLDE